MFYNEIRATGKAIEVVIKYLDSTIESLRPVQDLICNEFDIGFITKTLPKKRVFNQLAKSSKTSFVVKSISQHEMEPEQILVYEDGKLVDEQHRKPAKRRKL